MAKKTVEGGSKSTTQISEGVVLLGVGLLAFTLIYTLRGTGQLLKGGVIDPAYDLAGWIGPRADATVGWFESGWGQVTGAPEWAWRETIGQGGLGLTGGHATRTRVIRRTQSHKTSGMTGQTSTPPPDTLRSRLGLQGTPQGAIQEHIIAPIASLNAGNRVNAWRNKWL